MSTICYAEGWLLVYERYFYYPYSYRITEDKRKMLFHSIDFMIFFPVVLSAYFMMPKEAAQYLAAGGELLFLYVLESEICCFDCAFDNPYLWWRKVSGNMQRTGA